VDKNVVEIALQEAPDVPLAAGEGICLDFARTCPEQKRARFDSEMSAASAAVSQVECVGMSEQNSASEFSAALLGMEGGCRLGMGTPRN
jgi:hypothetical protein